MKIKRKLAALAAILLPVASLSVATPSLVAADSDPASQEVCEYMSTVWQPWAEPMYVTSICWHVDNVPWDHYGWAPLSVGGWADSAQATANVVVQGTHAWLWYVYAHEMAHLWDARVLSVYGMKPAIVQVMGWTEWPVELWADTFATCLGWMPKAYSEYWQAPRATPDQCFALDSQGLLPTTSPRGFQPI